MFQKLVCHDSQFSSFPTNPETPQITYEWTVNHMMSQMESLGDQLGSFSGTFDVSKESSQSGP